MSIDLLKGASRPEHLALLNRRFLVEYQRRLTMLFGGEAGVVDSDGLDALLKDAAALGESLGGKPDLTVCVALAEHYALALLTPRFKSVNQQLALVAAATLLRLNGWDWRPASGDLALALQRLRDGARGAVFDGRVVALD